MIRLLGVAAARSLICLAAILTLNFCLPRMMPGDPILHLVGVEDYYRYPEMAAEVRAKYGLDRPLHVQFVHYLVRLAQGDLGFSYQYRRPVADLVLHRLKWTLALSVPSLLIGTALAAWLGSLAGWHCGGAGERLATLSVLAVKSVPHYGLALLALLGLSSHPGWFPLAGAPPAGSGLFALVHHAALPVAVLSLSNGAASYFVLRNGLAELRQAGFSVTARAKGQAERRVLFGHAFPNAALPFLALLGMGLGFCVSGSLLVEIVFSWPGMGTLILNAVTTRDYPQLQGCFLLLAASVLAANAVTDFVYALCDPRVRTREAG